MTSKEYVNWFACGAADYRDGEPQKRHPGGEYNEATAFLPETEAYWDGWRSALMDGVMDTLKRR